MSLLISNLILSYFFVIGTMLLLWLLSIPLRNASIVDLYWGAGFGLLAMLLYSRIEDPNTWQGILMLLPTLWALRLTIYLMLRNIGHGEDPRYTKLRSWVPDEKSFHILSLKQVFMLQGHIMWVVSMPVIVGLSLPAQDVGVLTIAGCLVWLIGVLFEAVGDEQLRRFKANPANKGQIMDRGLWRYTRHPNYFGNASLWAGIFLVSAENPWCLLTVFSPLLMTHFLLNVTGMKLLEKKMQKEKPAYAEYMAKTPGFFPGIPKK
jgi:steroid 5-alpha reductase family enzyme